MPKTICDRLAVLLKQKAPYLKVSTESWADSPNPEIRDQCVIDYKDEAFEPLWGAYHKGSLAFDEKTNLINSDIPFSMKISGEEPKAPTNVVGFPEKCMIQEIHFSDHNVPIAHLHIKCEKLGQHGTRRIIDTVYRITRRTREYAGIG